MDSATRSMPLSLSDESSVPKSSAFLAERSESWARSPILRCAASTLVGSSLMASSAALRSSASTFDALSMRSTAARVDSNDSLAPVGSLTSFICLARPPISAVRVCVETSRRSNSATCLAASFSSKACCHTPRSWMRLWYSESVMMPRSRRASAVDSMFSSFLMSNPLPKFSADDAALLMDE